jgi:hypothetical protein
MLLKKHGQHLKNRAFECVKGLVGEFEFDIGLILPPQPLFPNVSNLSLAEVSYFIITAFMVGERQLWSYCWNGLVMTIAFLRAQDTILRRVDCSSWEG